MAKKHDEPEGGGEGWLVSYCDMISLLVTFFLMMMTFSTSSKGDVKSVGVGILKGRGGVFPNLTGYPAGDAPPEPILNSIAEAIEGQRGVGGLKDAIALSPEVVDWIIEITCKDRSYGARPLRRAIQRYVEDPLSEELIRGHLHGGEIDVYLDGGQLSYRPTGVLEAGRKMP